MRSEDIAKILERVDDSSKLVGEFTGIIKDVLAKDPKAIEGNMIEHAVRSHFGDSMYQKVSDIYKTIVGA